MNRRITFEYEVGDIVEASRPRGWRRAIYVLPVFFTAILLVSLGVEASRFGVGRVLRLDVAAKYVPFLLFTAAIVFGLPLVARLHWRGNRALHGVKTIVVDDDGVEVDSGDASGSYRWSAFTGVVETRNLFLLVRSRQTAVIVPKRALGGEDGVAELRALLKANVAEPA